MGQGGCPRWYSSELRAGENQEAVKEKAVLVFLYHAPINSPFPQRASILRRPRFVCWKMRETWEASTVVVCFAMPRPYLSQTGS